MRFIPQAVVFIEFTYPHTTRPGPAYSSLPFCSGEAEVDRNTKLLIMAALGLALLASYSAQALVLQLPV